MTRYGQTKTTLRDHQLAPKKRFGQNFLVRQQTAERIVQVSGVAKEDTVVEVGVGLGALTQPLAAAVKKVIGFEIDKGLVTFHQEKQDLPDNVELRHQDILTADFAALAKSCGGRFKILANLPYSISNPFIFKLIEERQWLTSAVVMLQKEVSDRLIAAPRTKQYGIPTVLLQSCASIQPLFTLKPQEFHPPPKIDSTVVHISFFETNDTTKFPPCDFKLLQQIVRTTFNQRRKTLSNTLATAALFSDDKQQNKEQTTKAISAAGFAATLRPEELTVADFIELANTIESHRSTASAPSVS